MTSELDRLLDEGESETTEFKATRAGLDSVARAVCGLLNQRGGVVLWGVADDGSVSGIREPEARAKELNDYLARNLSPRPLFSVSVEQARTGGIVIVDVAPGSDKPYSCGSEIWVRLGARTLRAGADRSAAIVGSAASALSRWERSVAPGFGSADCDPLELGAARREITRAGRFGIDLPEDDVEFMRRLYLEKNGQFTNAAVVLFARDPQAWAPNLGIRLVSYGDDRRAAIDNETVLEGPATRILKEAVAILQQRTGFSGQFRPSRLAREDRPAYPLFALREGLVNALAHRDYAAVGGQVRVELFPDRVTISNPGTLPPGMSTKDLYRRHPSEPHNPDIARVFYLREFMERLGMGTQRLVAACVEAGAKRPIWEVRQGAVWLTLFQAPVPAERDVVPGRQKTFLEATGPDVEFSADDYAQAAGVSVRQARRDLAELAAHGLVHRSGKGRATGYRRGR